MSMQFRTVHDQDIAAVELDPMKLEILHYGEILDPSLLDDLDADEKEALITWAPAGRYTIFYVEAAFQSLHYLLTGEMENGKGHFPLNFIYGDSRPTGEIGWGKAHFYTASEVQQIAGALHGLDIKQLRARAINGLSEQVVDYLLEVVEELKDFVQATADKQLGLYRVIV
ncbi:DUF1877 family protein [Chitinophaga skermanii]|nr:DUF1877 family protein [Chitinophaga skermanii]